MSTVLLAISPFLAGAIAGVSATLVIQPIDFVKTQLQLAEGSARSSALSVVRRVLATEGPSALYRGLGAAVTRQVVYGSARLGLFRLFSDHLKEAHGGAALPLALKVAAGLASGALGSIIGNPADLALVRMQADSALPLGERRGYRGMRDAVTRIVREEGVAALWRGSMPTVLRAMTLNAAMMATADQTKEALAPHLGGLRSTANLVVSSAVAGVAAACVSLPADLVKTRIMKQRRGVDGAMPYKGFFDCARQVVAAEGLAGFYRGLPTYILRIGPHGFIALIVLDAVSERLAALADRLQVSERESARAAAPR